MAWVSLKSPNKYQLNLDFDLKDQTTIMPVKQYDNYKIDGYLFSNGVPFFIDNSLDYYLRVRRPDGQVLFSNRDLSSSNYKSFLRFYITAEMTEIPGPMLADVAVYEFYDFNEEDETSYLIKSTQPFTIEVIPSPGPKPDGIIDNEGYSPGQIGGVVAHVIDKTLSFDGVPAPE